jgi:multidrug resistance efflux pump
VQAFVVPVAAEVSGTVLKVYVKNNDEVQAGKSCSTSIRSRTASPAAQPLGLRVGAALGQRLGRRWRRRAPAAGGRASTVYAEQDARAWNRSSRRTRARSRCAACRARNQPDQGAQPGEGGRGRPAPRPGGGGRQRRPNNAQLISARSAIEKAELDLRRTPRGRARPRPVTDLRTDVGQFAQAGAPAMTLIAVHDLWISADMTENNLGNIAPAPRPPSCST